MAITFEIELPGGDDRPQLARADLTFYGLDHSGPSYQVRVFFNNPNAGPALDPDGDGQTNLFEFTAGLIPTDPQSRFALAIAPVSGQPAQQKIIRAVKEGTAPDANLVKVAGLRSRQNTYLSVPLLWAMINFHTTFYAGGNLNIPGQWFWLAWLGIILIGWHIVFQLYKKAGKVQGF